MEEHGKRKAVHSPSTDNNLPSSRNNKVRKINPSEPVAESNITQILSNEGPKGSDLTQKLVTMWVSGSKGHNSLMSQEVRETIALRESQQKCTEAENLIQKIQEKVHSTEAVVARLTKSLESEERTKTNLIEKINGTAEVVTTITEHINYITDTLDRYRRHKDHLANLYDSIILQQRVQLGKLKNNEEIMHRRLLTLQNETTSLRENLKDSRISHDNELNKSHTKLANVVAQCEVMQRQLEMLGKEREEISSALSIKETYNLDFQKKISDYEIEVKNISNKLAEVSARFEAVKDEKSQLQNDLASKNSEMLKLVEDLDYAKTTHNEESAALASVKTMNNELERKLNWEITEREVITKTLNEANELNKELIRDVEKLKEETAGGMKEMNRRLESAEMEKIQIREEGKIINDEMEKKHELSIKSHIDKYESCLAEMKALNARHQDEMSRMSASSSAVVADANAENSRLVKQLDSLRREKEEREEELRQVEELLKKHMNSELQLKRKLEQYQSESAGLAASAVAAAEYKRIQDAENTENVKKIADLEAELFKLKFNQTKSSQSVIQESTTIEETEHRDKDRAVRKLSAASTYQKSILKRPMKPRKVRSSPSSPVVTSAKKITFLDRDSSSDASPVKLLETSNIRTFLNSEDSYGAIEKSCSQPLQATQRNSQSLVSQAQTTGKKFFKSRN